MNHETVAQLRRVIGGLARQFNASATGEGLTPSQGSVLGLIASRGSLAIAELTEIEGLNPTMMSRVIAKLDGAGLIRRIPLPDDLRTAFVATTPAGERMHKRLRVRRTTIVSECVSRLSERDVTALTRAIPALEALAEKLSHQTTGRVAR